MDRQFNWKGFSWLIGPKWGETHPNNSMYWWGTNAVEINDKDELELDIRYTTKLFDSVLKPYSLGFVRSELEYGYGTYEWEMTMPQGNYLWPALWLAADAEWPPEIDCMEGYSNEKGSYNKRLLFLNIKPNVHWNDINNNHKEQLKNNIPFFALSPKKKNIYKVILTPSSVTIWYNNCCVATYNDKEMLQHFNKEGIKWHINMNIGLQEKFNLSDYLDYRKKDKKMIIHNFKFIPLSKK